MFCYLLLYFRPVVARLDWRLLSLDQTNASPTPAVKLWWSLIEYEICYDMKDNKSMGCIYARGIHFLLTFEGVVLWFCICRTFDRSSFCYILPNRSSCNTRDSQCCILSPLLTSCFVSYVSYIHVTAVHYFILSSTNPKTPVPYRPGWRSAVCSKRRPRSPMPRE